MKKKFLFLVSFVVIFVTGCASTPRVVSTSRVYTKAPPTTDTSPYRFSQEPEKRIIENNGREFKRHVREMQKMRLEHERRLAAIEQASKEQRLAETNGLTAPAPQQSRAQKGVTLEQPQAQYSATPPVSQPEPASVSGIIPMYTPVYNTCTPVFVNVGDGGYFSSGYPVSGSDTWAAGGAYRYGAVGGGLGKFQRWLTQSQSSPGYRHTGGPVTIVNTYSVGGTVGGGGGFSSGLNFGYRR